jgi:hypothetical protein
MSEEQINIAIAEACGWTEISWEQLTNPREAIERKHYCKNNTEHFCGWLPDYCNDLNAMHEAEKVLPRQLYHVDYWQKGYGRFQTIVSEMTVTPFSATASQRAEAFLKTIGKWKD